MPFCRSLLILLCCAGPLGAQTGHLLYLGLTGEGWQVFRLDLMTGKTSQLTYMPGDKRQPTSKLDGSTVFFRDFMGDVFRIGVSNAVQPLFMDWEGCAQYGLTPDGKTLVFTRLATDNRQRQFLWRQPLDSVKPQLVYRPERGSVRHAAVSPDGKYVAGIEIWRLGEERLIVCPVNIGRQPRYLTPALEVVSEPAWSRDAKTIYFSQRKSGENYDLFKVGLETGAISAVVQTEATSEFWPCPDAKEQFVYYEERKDGRCHLASVEIATGRHRHLDLPHEAREPCWQP